MKGPGLARTYSMSVVGIDGHLVDVETYAGVGLVAFTLVGLLDTSVREARDRVRAAFESCGLDVLDQRITVNLSPARPVDCRISGLGHRSRVTRRV